MNNLNICEFPFLRLRDVPCGCAPPPLQCEVEMVDDLPACVPPVTGTAYFPSPPYPPNTPIENGDVFVVTDEFDDPTPFFFWDCQWYPFLSDSIDGDSDWFKEGTAGPFYGGVNTDPAYHEGTIGVRRTTIRENMAVDVGDSSGSADGGINAEGLYVSLDATPLPITGAGTRLMWIPRKAAFRAGGVDGTQWDTIGEFSFSTNANNIASGFASSAFGNGNESTGLHTTVFGTGNQANVSNDFVIGEDNICTGDDCFVGGKFCNVTAGPANAGRLFVFGRELSASGLRSTVLGRVSEVNGDTSFVQGENLVLNADNSVLFGQEIASFPVPATYTVDSAFITHKLRAFMHIPATAPTDSDIAVNHMSFWIDETANELVFRTRDSGGTYQTARVALV